MFHHNWITRGLALCLLIGPLGPIYQLLTQVMAAISDGKPGSILILLPVFLLLGFCLYTGYRFLLGSAKAYRWALYVFISQIPILSLGRFGLRWNSGFEIPLAYRGLLDERLSFVFWDQTVDYFVIGFNLFALLASSALFRARKQISPVGV
ncbi:hypothetical protein [Agrobacterium rosae]|uniref:hypothetical protein n=1 Tax=Agrobacterium rosae TaxID=1972867 RepID=UPI003A8107FD